MSNVEFLQYLTINGVLELVGVFSYALRFLGWKLIEVLVDLVNGLENAVSKIYKLNTFFESTEIEDFLDKYKNILWIIFAIAIAVVGFQIIMQRKKDKGQFPVNIAISIAVIVLLPTIMNTLGKTTNLIVGQNVGTYASTGSEIVKNNLSDLYYLDKIDYNLEDKRNDISKDNVMNIEINEKLDNSKIEDRDKKDILKQKLTTNKNGELTTKELGESFFSFLDENYYRYNMSFLIVIVSLAVTAVTLICCSLKVGRIIIELAFNRILATVLAFGDVGNGKRLKSVIENILSMFAILIVTSVLLNIYNVFTGWLATSTDSTDSIVRLMVLIGASWAVIDGPNIIERIFGIDAGIKSSWGLVLAGMQGVKSAGRAISSTGRLAKNGFKLGKFIYNKAKNKNGNNPEENPPGSNEGTTKNNKNNKNKSSNEKTADYRSKSNRRRFSDSSKNNNFSRNSGIYDATGGNINNNETENAGNKTGSNFDRNKGNSMNDRRNNLDKNSNNLNRNQSSGENTNVNSNSGNKSSMNSSMKDGNSRFSKDSNFTPNTNNSNKNENFNTNKSQGNINNRAEKKSYKINNNNFDNIKKGDKK
ncbi:pLS20_p028 family conjugation system transmembrane protein [Clostridium baratii]|uniref:pLS20_p028 family conjugation system transmembrane protein n=1 Tax=Clostridium baratii TaxID=1561 RepID=UPI0030CFA04E